MHLKLNCYSRCLFFFSHIFVEKLGEGMYFYDRKNHLGYCEQCVQGHGGSMTKLKAIRKNSAIQTFEKSLEKSNIFCTINSGECGLLTFKRKMAKNSDKKDWNPTKQIPTKKNAWLQ